MKISKLIIKSSSGKYPILIGSNVISNISKLMFNNSINFEKCLLVVDKNVPKKFISKIRKSLKNKKLFIFLMTANEKNKNQKTTNSILQILLDKNFSPLILKIFEIFIPNLSSIHLSTSKKSNLSFLEIKKPIDDFPDPIIPKNTIFLLDFIIFFIEKSQICLNLKLTKVICNL